MSRQSAECRIDFNSFIWKIKISDDGREIDAKKIATQAAKIGLINQSQLREISRKEIII